MRSPIQKSAVKAPGNNVVVEPGHDVQLDPLFEYEPTSHLAQLMPSGREPAGQVNMLSDTEYAAGHKR